MNDNQSNAVDRDELRDRLIDGALRELLGGEEPPELSERILTAAAAAPLVSVNRGGKAINASSNWNLRAGLVYGALAASVLLGSVALLTPKIQTAWERATQKPLEDLAMREKVHTLREQVHKEQAKVLAEKLAREAQELDKLLRHGTAAEIEDALIAKSASSSRSASPSPADDAREPEVLSVAPPFRDLASSTEQSGSHAAVSDGPYFRDESFGLDSYGRGASRGGYGGGSAVAGRSVSSAQEPIPPSQRTIADPDSAASLKEQLFEVQLAIQQRTLGRPRGRRELQRLVELRDRIQERYAQVQNGRGPELGGDKYNRIVENPFKPVSAANTDNRLSTFSIDVDTASYANVRQFLMQSHTLPPADAVRIEELVNYVDYDYSPPSSDAPFAAHVEAAACPWNAEHRLVRIGVKGREVDRTKRPPSNLVFLIDVSGSMDEPNKLPLLLEGMKLLTRELGENDRVAIVVYASSEGVALESTRGDQQATILAALDQLRAGGSTAGGAGILRAYQMAADHFIRGGVNRVILCTDGDFNVGVTSPAELERLAETKAKESGVFLTVLGFGRGNLNDALMEQIADKGNGNYHYIDGRSEARKVLVEEMTGTLVTIAKDVKIQVEFNPTKVSGYRLIGYENRVLAAEDFNDDQKDAGEIGAGHTVTALYEVVPAGQRVDASQVDELKYGGPTGNAAPAADASAPWRSPDAAAATNELLTLKIRFKQPDGATSTKLEFPLTDSGQAFAAASDDFKFASAVASFGMLLRDSQHKGNATYASVLATAEAATGDRDPHGYRREFVELVQRAKELAGQ